MYLAQWRLRVEKGMRDEKNRCKPKILRHEKFKQICVVCERRFDVRNVEKFGHRHGHWTYPMIKKNAMILWLELRSYEYLSQFPRMYYSFEIGLHNLLFRYLNHSNWDRFRIRMHFAFINYHLNSFRVFSRLQSTVSINKCSLFSVLPTQYSSNPLCLHWPHNYRNYGQEMNLCNVRVHIWTGTDIRHNCKCSVRKQYKDLRLRTSVNASQRICRHFERFIDPI